MTRATTDSVPSIDVRALVRAARGGRGGPRAKREMRIPSTGAWTAKGFPGWRMPSTGAEWRALSLTVRGEAGVCRVWVSDGGGAREHRIELAGERVHLGGVRWWAACPGCGKRRGAIYFAGGLARCRACFGLAYQCQRVSPFRRAGMAIGKLGDALGVNNLMDEPLRPRGMRRARYARLIARWREQTSREMEHLPRWCGGFL